ncbi:hypothetical protein B0H34DRAFT_685340, partial [Crassisporium funariophilum]
PRILLASPQKRTNWTTENLPEFGPHPSNHRAIVWFHNGTIFYAHDWQKRLWIYKDIPAKPYAKGDGASLMIAHYISADFGWLMTQSQLKRCQEILQRLVQIGGSK